MPYQIQGKEYPAYGYFFSSVEKYVLIREANMWTSNSHEHILFLTVDTVTEATMREIRSLLEDYLEPELVRKGQKYPTRDHMYSYLTIAVLSEKEPDKAMKKAIRRFRYEKGYLFNFRGFSQGRVICASMENEQVVANYQARKLKKLYLQVFADVHAGKKTFSRQCEEEGITPFSQENH
jgi:hypothetical protein